MRFDLTTRVARNAWSLFRIARSGKIRRRSCGPGWGCALSWELCIGALRRMGLKARLRFLQRCHYTLPEPSSAASRSLCAASFVQICAIAVHAARSRASAAALARVRQSVACSQHSLGVARRSIRSSAGEGRDKMLRGWRRVKLREMAWVQQLARPHHS